MKEGASHRSGPLRLRKRSAEHGTGERRHGPWAPPSSRPSRRRKARATSAAPSRAGPGPPPPERLEARRRPGARGQGPEGFRHSRNSSLLGTGRKSLAWRLHSKVAETEPAGRGGQSKAEGTETNPDKTTGSRGGGGGRGGPGPQLAARRRPPPPAAQGSGEQIGWRTTAQALAWTPSPPQPPSLLTRLRGSRHSRPAAQAAEAGAERWGARGLGVRAHPALQRAERRAFREPGAGPTRGRGSVPLATAPGLRERGTFGVC